MDALVIAALVKVIGVTAKKAKEEGGDALMELAAYLFAIRSTLLRDLPLADLHSDEPHSPLTLPDPDEIAVFLGSLSELPRNVTASALCEEIARALRGIEQCYLTRQELGLSETGSFSLREITAGKHSLLGGRVFWWPRWGSVLQRLRDGRWRQPRDKGPPWPYPHPEEGLSRLGLYWQEGHASLPIKVEETLSETDPLIKEVGRDLTERRSFRIALCPLGWKTNPLFVVDRQSWEFTAQRHAPFTDREALHRELRQVLAAASRQQVHLVVLPELHLDQETLRLLPEWVWGTLEPLPYAILAGSAHCWDPTSHSENLLAPPPVNQSHLLLSHGRPALSHHKRGRFRLTPDLIKKAPHFYPDGDELKELAEAGRLPEEIPEGIERGTELRILETALGRMAILICADAIDAQAQSCEAAVQLIRPDLLFVPAMSAKTTPFLDLLTTMSRHAINTFFVNAACVCKEGRVLAMFSLAFPQPTGAAPTRVRWRKGMECLEAYDWSMDVEEGQEERRWRHMLGGAMPPGTEWLSDGSALPLGLVVDLGAHHTHHQAPPSEG